MILKSLPIRICSHRKIAPFDGTRYIDEAVPLVGETYDPGYPISRIPHIFYHQENSSEYLALDPCLDCANDRLVIKRRFAE